MTDDRSPRPAPARCFVVTRVAADDAPVRVLAICSDGARAASALAAGLGGNAGARDDAWQLHWAAFLGSPEL